MRNSNTSKSTTTILCTVINDLTTDQRMHRICDALTMAGYDVVLIGRKLPESRPLVHRSFGQKRLTCWFHKGFLFYMEYNIRLLCWMMFRKVDVINAVDLDTIIPAWVVAKLRGKKVVYDAHEWFPYCPEIEHRPFVHRFWLRVEKTFVPKMDAAYTVCQSIADALSSQYAKTVGVVRNVPIQRIAQREKTEPYILYQGALNVGRGLKELIEAMEKIDIPLLIAGTGDIENELKNQVLEMQVPGRVKFLGQLTPEELWSYTQNAYIGMNLLENLGKSYYYSLSNKFFDYIQAGIPQVSMNFPEYRSLNNEYETALLIDDLQTSTIVNAILKLVDDREIYSKLKNNCLQAKEVWNWENEKENLINIYDRLG